jgi:type IV secretory pathway VirB3-like protein
LNARTPDSSATDGRITVKPSTFTMYRIGQGLIGVMFVLGVTMTALGAIGAPQGAVVMVLLWLWLASIFLMLTVLPIVFFAARNAELRQGYLTVASGFINADTVDPRTRRVLRLAGEPPMTMAEFNRARRVGTMRGQS